MLEDTKERQIFSAALQNEEELPQQGSSQSELLKEFGTTAPLPAPTVSRIHCLNIIGQVEGHMLMPPQNKTTKYEHIIPQLAAIELDERIEGVLIILNTVGGDVEAGRCV